MLESVDQPPTDWSLKKTIRFQSLRPLRVNSCCGTGQCPIFLPRVEAETPMRKQQHLIMVSDE